MTSKLKFKSNCSIIWHLHICQESEHQKNKKWSCQLHKASKNYVGMPCTFDKFVIENTDKKKKKQQCAENDKTGKHG